jgi:hypothetical protein
MVLLAPKRFYGTINAQSYYFKRKYIYRHRRVIREDVFCSAFRFWPNKPPLRGYGDGNTNFCSPTQFSFAPLKSEDFICPQLGLSTGISEVESCGTRVRSQVLGPNQMVGELGRKQSAGNRQESTLCLVPVRCRRWKPCSNQRWLSLDEMWHSRWLSALCAFSKFWCA